MRDRSDESISPPPDDGGHLGSFTKPEDLRAFPPEPPRDERHRAEGPDTRRTVGNMHRRSPRGSPSAHALTVAIMLLAAVVISASFFVF